MKNKTLLKLVSEIMDDITYDEDWEKKFNLNEEVEDYIIHKIENAIYGEE
jgi:hypothetical protein